MKTARHELRSRYSDHDDLHERISRWLIWLVVAVLIVLASATSGCTRFHIKQGDVSPERSITFDLTGTAWFSGSQAIANLKAMQTDKTQSFGTDSMSQKGPTNTAAVINSLTELLKAAHP